MFRCIHGCIAGTVVFATESIELSFSSISKCKWTQFIRFMENEDSKRLPLQGKGIL
jgi:hypothetical protein